MDEATVVREKWGYRIVLDRPPVNALSDALVRSLTTWLTDLIQERPPVVVLTGGGKHFSAGADMKEAHDDASALQERLRRRLKINELLRVAPFPVIAAVNGACRGGAMNLVANCDFRIAHERATFSLPEIKVGRSGGAATLRGLMTEGTIRWLAMTGLPMDAATALQSGFVAKVIDDGSWTTEVDRIAADMAACGAPGLYAVKESLDRSRGASVADAQWIEQQLTYRLFTEGHRQRWES